MRENKPPPGDDPKVSEDSSKPSGISPVPDKGEQAERGFPRHRQPLRHRICWNRWSDTQATLTNEETEFADTRSTHNRLRPDLYPGHYRLQPWKSFIHTPRTHHHPEGVFFRLVFIFGAFVTLVVATLVLLVSLIEMVVGAIQPSNESRFIIGIAFSLLCGIAITAVYVGRRAYKTIASPMAELMSAAEAVTEGNLSTRVPALNGNRLSGVMDAFNTMVSSLERADQQRRNLTADVAHELRTPLQIIRGNLEGVLDGVYEPTNEHIEATLEATQQLSRLVEDLRTLSLAESGQLTLHMETIDIKELLLDTQTNFSNLAEASGVDIRVVVPGADKVSERWTVRGDPGRLDQIMANLVVNAIRHTPQGGSIILQADSGANGVEIQVSDTGEGITPEDLPFIFDRFWRGNRARTRQSGTGSGLGLAITRQLVRLHGGTIDVTSTLGEGTTFTIHFPAVSQIAAPSLTAM
jgi:signal transduction histidine kinase